MKKFKTLVLELMSKSDLISNSINPELETEKDGTITSKYVTEVGNDVVSTHINHDPNSKMSYISFKVNDVDTVYDNTSSPTKVAKILNTVAGNIKHHFENNEVELLTHFTHEPKKARIYEKMAKLHGVNVLNILKDKKNQIRKNKF